MNSITKTVFLFLFLIAGAFLLNGSLGFKEKDDCNPTETITDTDGTQRMRTEDERMECLRMAAISEALKGNAKAKDICDEINNNAVSNNDYKLRANMCYTEIAKILVDESICNNIEDVGKIFSGYKTTREGCIIQVTQLDNALNKQQQICTVIFIVPILLVGIIAYGKRIY